MYGLISVSAYQNGDAQMCDVLGIHEIVRPQDI